MHELTLLFDTTWHVFLLTCLFLLKKSKLYHLLYDKKLTKYVVRDHFNFFISDPHHFFYFEMWLLWKKTYILIDLSYILYIKILHRCIYITLYVDLTTVRKRWCCSQFWPGIDSAVGLKFNLYLCYTLTYSSQWNKNIYQHADTMLVWPSWCTFACSV